MGMGPMSSSRFVRTLAVTRHVAQTLCAMILFRDYVAEAAMVHYPYEHYANHLLSVKCEGESMLPTLRAQGDAILVEKLTVALRDLHRGDVVVATSPNEPDKLICKRIIAMVRTFVGLWY